MKIILITLLFAVNVNAQTVIARAHTDQVIAQKSGINSEAWHAATGRDGIQRVNVECGNGYIDPPEIVVKTGVPVVLSIRTGRNVVSHEITVANQRRNIDKKPILVSFTPTVSGHFPIVCSCLGDAKQKRKEAKLHVVQ